jgi:hypothetical protein
MGFLDTNLLARFGASCRGLYLAAERTPIILTMPSARGPLMAHAVPPQTVGVGR